MRFPKTGQYRCRGYTFSIILQSINLLENMMIQGMMLHLGAMIHLDTVTPMGSTNIEMADEECVCYPFSSSLPLLSPARCPVADALVLPLTEGSRRFLAAGPWATWILYSNWHQYSQQGLLMRRGWHNHCRLSGMPQDVGARVPHCN